jgi:phosphate transport system substrate-binding protein
MCLSDPKKGFTEMKEIKPSMPKRARRILAALCVGVAVMGPVAMASSASAATPVSVLGSGSDVTFHVMTRLDLLYDESPGCTTIAPTGTQPLDFSCIPQAGDITSENANHNQVHEAFPIGGSSGEQQLCSQGLAGVANISYARQTSVSDKCTGLHYVAYARDGITWEAFPGAVGSATASMHNTSGACAGSTGFCLTHQQLVNIYVNCTITNWNQVGGANKAIKRYTILPQYGTRKAFDTFLGGSSSTCAGTKQIDQTNNAQIAAADRAAAIVPVDTGSWKERYSKKPAGSALGSVDGVAPDIKNILSGAFPFSRFLYNVYCAGDPANSNKCGTASPSSAAVTGYIGERGWLCKTTHAADPISGVGYRSEIASAITNFGFAPLPKGATGGGTTTTNYCRLFTS